MKKIDFRYFDGTITGQIQEGDSIRVRIAAAVTLQRDTDGSWLVFSTLDSKNDTLSKELTIIDPAACQAFDALFELIADPVEFEGATFGERDAQEVA